MFLNPKFEVLTFNICIQAGWGIYESNKTSDKLLFAEVESVSDEVCWNDNNKGDHFLEYLSAASTFCGGNVGQLQGPCNGNSGKFNLTMLLNPTHYLHLHQQEVDSTFNDREASSFKESFPLH